MKTPTLRIERKKEVSQRTGLPPTTLADRISNGLFPKPIPLGGRTVGWPSYEVDQVIKAMIAGKSEIDVRKLVSTLEAERRL